VLCVCVWCGGWVVVMWCGVFVCGRVYMWWWWWGWCGVFVRGGGGGERRFDRNRGSDNRGGNRGSANSDRPRRQSGERSNNA